MLIPFKRFQPSEAKSEVYKALGLQLAFFPNIILEGPSGTGKANEFHSYFYTGKTKLVRALCAELGFLLLPLNVSDVKKALVGEGSKVLEKLGQWLKVFRQDNPGIPLLVFFDEVDAIFMSRTLNDPSHTRELLCSLLVALQTLDSLDEIAWMGYIA